MRVDRSYCSNQNTWSKIIRSVLWYNNTEQFCRRSDARAHARAQYQEIFRICRRIIT